MPTDLETARRIDEYFERMDAYPWVPYVPIGHDAVEVALTETGADNLWPSTAATVCEIEGGGKNVFGCDRGALYCNLRVTRPRVRRVLRRNNLGIPMQGIGVTQITYRPFVDQAEELGGAHILRNQMVVGFNILNDLLNRYDYLNALEAYNDGNPRFNDPANPYDQKFAALHAAWKERLA